MVPRIRLHRKYCIFILAIFIGFLSCHTKSKKGKGDLVNLNGIQYDTLFLYHQGAHCGEWGGNQYKVKVFRQKPDKNLIAILKLIRMKCDESGISEYPDTTMYNENLIQNCLVELMKLQISNNSSVGHAGTYNAAWRSDSTFTLKDYPSRIWTNFDKLLKRFEKR
jgi:hypothetical protein